MFGTWEVPDECMLRWRRKGWRAGTSRTEIQPSLALCQYSSHQSTLLGNPPQTKHLAGASKQGPLRGSQKPRTLSFMSGRNQIHTDVGKQKQKCLGSCIELSLCKVWLQALTDPGIKKRQKSVSMAPLCFPRRWFCVQHEFSYYTNLAPTAHPKINLYFPVFQPKICRPTILGTICVTCPPVNQLLRSFSGIRLARSKQYAVGGL